MTDKMLELARANQAKAGVTNVEFLKGEIESIPLPDNSVDVIISNRVINPSGRQGPRPAGSLPGAEAGGRFAVSGVVTRGDVPDEVGKHALLWVGRIAGALQDNEYRAKLGAAGFEGVDIEPARVYDIEDARQLLTTEGIDVDAFAPGTPDATGRTEVLDRGSHGGSLLLRIGALRPHDGGNDGAHLGARHRRRLKTIHGVRTLHT